MDGKELRELAESWVISMEAEGLALRTIRNYRATLLLYLGWCEQHGADPGLGAADSVRAWLAALRADGIGGGTRQVRLAALRRYAAWLAAEPGIDLAASGIHSIPWPKVDETLPRGLTDGQVDALIAACDPKTYVGIRDAAIISLMVDGLLRADELLSMAAEPADVDLRNRTAHIRRGKGGRERVIAFSRQTAMRLDRYQRARARQRHAASSAYWLGYGRDALSYQALHAMISRRGKQLGIHVHPHMTRRTGAIRWRRRGGTTEGLMTIAGWTDPKMVMLYTRAAEVEIALDEARRLHDGA